MAAPSTVTTLNLTGKYIMNKTLSDDSDEILRLQGVGWVMRRAIGMATLTLAVNHNKGDDGYEHIDIDQTLTGGISGTSEKRILDWTERKADDRIFGAVVSKSRRLKLEEIENEFLKKDWLPDTAEHGAINSYVYSDTPKSNTSWTAEQIWGFEEIEIGPGKRERRYARHINFTGPKEENIQVRLVYDYISSS
jgi:hypothetical protein